MSLHECPDPETLAVFALGQSSGEEWRRIVRHLADCAICRRQVALAAENGDVALPAPGPVRMLPLPERTRAWQRVAQGIAAAALLAAGIAWALVHRPVPPAPKESPSPVVRPQPAPQKPFVPAPRAPEPLLAQPEKAPAPPPEHFIPRPKPAPETPAPELVQTPPGPSPFLAERATSMVAEAIEVTAGEGTVSRRSGQTVTPLRSKTMIQPSDTLFSPVGGSLLLPDGATVHLGRESELRVSWSQTLACATVDVRKGGAVVDLGKTARPLHVAHGPLGVHLRDSAGLLWVSAGEQSLRATPLSGATQFRTRGGEARRLDPLQSLVLGEAGDSLESVEKADFSVFPTLEARGRPAPPMPPPSEKKPPLLDQLLTALGSQSYAYRISGRQVREGVWSPAGFYTSAVEDFTAAKRLDDKEAVHLRRGGRAWNDLGKIAPGGRDARLLEVVKGSQAPHAMLSEIVGAVRGESAPRSDKVHDRVCLSWDLALDSASLRPFMEKILDQAVADGRLEKPDTVYWDTLEGSLECAALKFDAKILRVIDRRKVSYSYKTVSGLDRRSYLLETVYEFFSHGLAAMPLPAEMIKELSFPKK
jgi:hypothetical protein